MNYKKIKRGQIDKCNICGVKTKLTWDHVPPKCCNNRYSIKVNSWVKGLPLENSYEKQYQNGIRFRTLCEKCNNDLLGAKYDTVLAEFTNQVTSIVTTSVILPAVINVPVKVNQLARAICGHLLAAKDYYEDVCSIDKQLREYVTNDKMKPPDDMSLLYWIYPYSTIALMRDVTVKSFSNKYVFPEGTISIINSFPVAYILSTSVEDKCGLVDLFKYCNDDIDAVVNVPIDCRSCYFSKTEHLRPFLWPCNVSDEDDGAAFLLSNGECMDGSRVAIHSRESVMKIRERE